MGKKKSASETKGTPDPRKGMTFRLNDADLAYKLRMVIEDMNSTAAEFIEPIIKEVVELKFEMLKKKLNSMAKPKGE